MPKIAQPPDYGALWARIWSKTTFHHECLLFHQFIPVFHQLAYLNGFGKCFFNFNTNKNAVKKSLQSSFAVLAFVIGAINFATAQEKKVAPTPPGLFIEIARMDSALFDAFNSKNLLKFQSLFSKDLEWFQDNGGLLRYKTVFANFVTMFKQQPDLKRELVPGSLEVHPVKDYGAIQTGMHRFRHFENGKEEAGTFKFLMIWRKKDGLWKITRVVSYDH